ncbi:YecA family protein [Lancefieldella rimae]|uniref:YecA family protein n=1 Tax=Lancefieldella rimae TaxID=1383 RepID=UPI003C6FA5F5
MIGNELKNAAPARMKQLAKEINKCIKSIRSYIQIDRQEILLMVVTDISSFSNPILESNILFYKQDDLPSHPVEYLQSLIAATDNTICSHVSDEDIEQLAYRYLQDQKMLFDKSIQYLFYRELALGDGSETSQLAFEAQLMNMVRGNRYRFLQVDYLRPLVFAHNDEFQELFNMTANEVVAGYKKLETALSNGRLEGMGALMRLFEKSELADDFDILSISEEDSKAAKEASLEAFSVCHFNVNRITGWPKAFIDALSFTPGEARFFEGGEMQYWPIVTLPIVDRPFILINGESYCFDYYSLTDNFYRAIQKSILRTDSNYSERWQQEQKEASERMVESIFKDMLPGCVTYMDNCYGSKKHRSENDLLVKYRDALLVIEVKAGRFTDVPPVSNFDSHIKRYKELIEKSNSQCAQMRDYIRSSNTDLVLYNEHMQPKQTLDISDVKSIFCLSITVDNINTYAARAEKLAFLNLEEGVSCIAIDDLMTYREYFDNSLEFLHFLKQREIAALNKRLALTDELDHLGMYIAHNCYSLEVDSIPEKGILYMSGYREKLDNYFERVGTPLPQLEKPRQSMPKRFREIINVLHSSGNPQAVQISLYLLDFSSDAREQLANGIETTLKRQAITNRQLAFSFSGTGKSIRMTYFVFQDELSDAKSDQEMFDYAAATLLANNENERILLSFKFDTSRTLQTVGMRVICADQIPSNRIIELKNRGKQMGDFRVAKCIEQYGKIGRNQPCPCGSGMKYKRCHGQNK